MYTRLFARLLFVLLVLLFNGGRSQIIAREADGVRVIVIDAGHGGKFPGAHYAGIKEKDLTLNIALRLGKLIEAGMPGVTVVYTRKTDTELSEILADDLQKRASIANKNNGNLFISIHVNAAKSTSAKGVETLIMGETPKEQRYNENALYESNREDLIDMSDVRQAAIVRAYIQNLQFTYGQYSMALARCMHESFRKSGREVRKIKPQLLRVLYAADMPAVLTEIGFMSNSQEAAYMKSEKGQAEIARDLYNAVREYAAYVEQIQRAEEGEITDTTSTPPAVVGNSSSAEASAVDNMPAPELNQPVGKPDKPAKQNIRIAEYYAIQLLASPKSVPLKSSQFKVYKGKAKEYVTQGKFRYKYCVGEYSDRPAAVKALAGVKKHFPDAFVVRCKGKEIVK